VRDIDRSWPLTQLQENWARLPLDFMRDLLVENARCQVAHPEMKIEDVFKDRLALRSKGFYRQKVEQDPKAS
jgi:hypothetical protein